MHLPSRVRCWWLLAALAPGLVAGATPPKDEGGSLPEPLCALRGSVVDPDGQPVQGAQVLAQRIPGAAEAQKTRGSRRTLSTKTREDGTFRIDTDEVGPFRIRVLAPGYVPYDLSPVTAGGEARIVGLSPGRRLEGKLVQSEDGEAVSGGEVAACDAGAEAWGETGCHRTPSDEQGRFRVTGLPEGPVVLRARAPGRASTQRRLPSRRGGGALQIPMSPGGVLAGRVVDVEGHPVEGVRAEVRVVSMDRSQPDWLLEPGRTDERGLFRFDGVPAGVAVVVRVSGERWLPVHSAPAELRPGEVRSDIELAIRAGGWARIRLEDGEHRLAPLPEAEIVAKVGRADSTGVPVAKDVQVLREDTEQGPAYRIGPFPPGRHRLVLRHADYQDVPLTVAIPEDGAVVDLGAVRVSPGTTLEGVVKDADARPVAGAVIDARQEDAPHPRGRISKTDESGHFSIPGWAGGTVTLEIRAPGFAPWRRTGVDPRAGVIEVVLEPASSVTLVLRDEAGRPLRGRPYLAAAYAVTEDDTGTRLAPTWTVRTRGSSEDGRGVLENLPAGRYRIRAVARGYLPAETDEVDIPPGKRVDLGTIILRRGIDLEGRVVDGDGRPVGSAAVSVERPGPAGLGRPFFRAEDAPVLTDGQGSFILEGLEPGLCRLQVLSEGYSPASVLVRIPEDRAPEPQIITLARGGTVRGTVRDAQGAPVADTGVALLRLMPPELLQITRTDAEGWFTFRRVTPGHYQVMVRSTSEGAGGGRMKAVRVREDETVEVHLGGRSPIRVHGRVLRAGKPVPGVRLLFFRSGSGGLPSGFQTTTADGEGRYAIGLDEPGDYTVGVVADDGGTSASERLLSLRIPEEPDVPHDLLLVGGVLTGQVVGPEGNPVAGAGVQVQAASPNGRNPRDSSRTTTGEDGRFVVSDLPPGTYVVEASADGFAPAREGPVVLGDSAATEVRLVLSPGIRVSGVVVTPDGRPMPGAVVVAVTAPSAEVAGGPVTADAAGQFVLELSAGRPVRLVALGTPYAPGVLDVDEPEGLAQPLTLSLREGAELKVEYVDLSGRPAVGGALEIQSGDPLAALALMITGQFRPVAGPDGSVEVRGLPAGTYTIRGLDPETPESSVHLPPSGQVRVHLSPGR